jgi:hypothetical protein
MNPLLLFKNKVEIKYNMSTYLKKVKENKNYENKLKY